MTDDEYREMFIPLIDYLKDIGCDKQQHSGNRNLLHHLVGVSVLLSERGCSDDLCKAGLFHSIYGTTIFKPKMVSLEDRDKIKDLIGVWAENLVYEFSMLPKDRIGAIKKLDVGDHLKNDLYDIFHANHDEQKKWKVKNDTTRMIEIHNDVVEDHVAELIASEMKGVYWRYEYHSKGRGLNKHPSTHWHRLCGNSGREIIANGFDWVMPIWTSAMYKYEFKKNFNIDTYKRIYMNSHTHGIEPVLHTDDGDFTMIYYPRMDWKPEWGGGTLIDGQLVPYVGNSLVIFDAHLPHMAMPVTKECYELRSVIVFKCNRDV
jgi:hypothetical protein